MGCSVEAICDCGFHASALVGGGMREFQSVCRFPAYCECCHLLVEVNLLVKTPRCPHCQSRRVRSYDHPSLQGQVGKEEVVSWNVSDRLGRVLMLHDGTYLCPACGQLTLRFSHGGIYGD